MSDTLEQRFEQPEYVASVRERFWRFVKAGKTSECWLWKGFLAPSGYGRLSWGYKNPFAHRVSYRLNYGPIPPGLCVLHRCDQRSCVNPAHLFLGTKTENNWDRDRKGRTGKLCGEAANGARLTNTAVRDIRANYQAWNPQFNAGAFARKYGVRIGAINRVLSAQTWKGVTP